MFNTSDMQSTVPRFFFRDVLIFYLLIMFLNKCHMYDKEVQQINANTSFANQFKLLLSQSANHRVCPLVSE